MIIIGVSLYTYYHYFISHSAGGMNTNHVKKSFWGRCILYAGLLWIVHITLDWNYPLALFYPLSDRLYQIDFVYLLDLSPWFFFPVMIVGAQFRVISISYLRGITSYFINLTPSERVAIFGTDVIAIPIEDFLLHVILFIFFLQFVGKPMFPDISHKRIASFKYLRGIDRYLLITGIVFLITGLVMGPMIGNQTIDKSSINSSFRISSQNFTPSVAVSAEPTSYLFQPQTIMKISGSFEIQSNEGTFDHVLLITTQQAYDEFIRGISTLFTISPPNTSDNLILFNIGYSTLLSNLYSSALAMNLTNNNETAVYTEVISDSVAIISVIENWNNTLILGGNEQVMDIQISITVTSSRLTLFLIGLGSMVAGMVVIAISCYFIKFKKIENT